MAFQKTFQHTGLAAICTHSEALAWLSTLTPGVRANLVGCTVTVTDKGTQDLWVISATDFYPIKDLVPDYIQGVAQTDTITLSVDGNSLISGVVKTSSTGGIESTVNGISTRVATSDTVTLAIDGTNSIVAATKIVADPLNAVTSTVNGIQAIMGSATTSTATVDPSIVSGVTSFTTNVKLNSLADNAISVGSSPESPEGLYVKKLTIAPSSVGILGLSATNELSFDRDKLVNLHVDSVSTSFADFVTNVLPTLAITKGDMIFIQNAPNSEKGWVSKIDAPTLGTDFFPYEYPDYTIEQIAAEFSAINGVAYNPTTRVFSGVADSVASRNDLTVSTNGFLVDVYGAANGITGGIGVVTLTANLEELYSRIATLNAVTYENLITKTGSKVEAGGTATKNTTMALGDFVVDYSANVTGGIKIGTENFAFMQKSFLIQNELGEWLKVGFNSANFLNPTPVSSIPF